MSETVSETPADAALSEPSDAAEWRAFIASLPARDLFRAAQRDKFRAARLFTGFRITPEALKNSLVQKRLVEEAMRSLPFAAELLLLKPSSDASVNSLANGSENGQATASLSFLAEAAPEDAEEGDAPGQARLKQKVKEQRIALREREERIAQLEAALSETERARDAAKGEAETARTAQKAAETEADRQKRQRERDEKKRAAEKAAPTPAPSVITFSAAAPAVSAERGEPLWEESLGRLLNKGKSLLVAETCQEAMLVLLHAENKRGAGGVYALFAEAMYAQEAAEQGALHDRAAVPAFLEEGRAADAACSLARALSQGETTLSRTDAATLKRILPLAKRTGELGAAVGAFGRLRGAGSLLYTQVREAIRAAGGAEAAAFLESGARAAAIGYEETVALPSAHGPASSVSAHEIVTAIEVGDEVYIGRIREGLAALRGGGNAALADNLVAAVRERNAAFAVPLVAVQPPTPVVVDASNVARHNPDPLALTYTPQVSHLLLMRDTLLRYRYFPVLLIADANLRFHMSDKAAYENLALRGVVREAEPGTSADEVLLQEARFRSAPIVSNDRLAEWGARAAGIERIGFGLHNGVFTLTAL